MLWRKRLPLAFPCTQVDSWICAQNYERRPSAPENDTLKRTQPCQQGGFTFPRISTLPQPASLQTSERSEKALILRVRVAPVPCTLDTKRCWKLIDRSLLISSYRLEELNEQTCLIKGKETPVTHQKVPQTSVSLATTARGQGSTLPVKNQPRLHTPASPLS